VSNGKLVSISKAPDKDNMKTWTWRESLPSSTYLITVVAGEFDEVKQTWRGEPVTYYAPKGRGDRLLPNLRAHTAMMELFSKKLGVDLPGKNIRKQWSTISWPAEWKIPAPPRTPAVRCAARN